MTSWWRQNAVDWEYSCIGLVGCAIDVGGLGTERLV